MKKLLFALVLVLGSWRTTAQLTSDSAFRFIQDARGRVNRLLNQPNYKQSDIDWGISLLDSIYHIVDTRGIKTTAYDVLDIKYRFYDLFYDLGEIYAMEHKLDSSMYFFRKMYRIASFRSSVDLTFTDSTEKDLWTYPPFLDLVGKMRRQERMMHDSTLQTPYVANLPDDQKIAGLTLLWSQAKYNFVNFDHIDVDWDKQYLDYLPKVKASASTKEYYRILMRFYASLKDGHTNVYVPDTLRKDFYAKPPIWAALIGGQVLITDVRSDSLEKQASLPDSRSSK